MAIKKWSRGAPTTRAHVLSLFGWMKCKSQKCFRFIIQAFPGTEWSGYSGAPLQLLWGHVSPCVGSSVGLQHADRDKTQSRAVSFTSSSHLGWVAVVVALYSMSIQTSTHFPGLGVWETQDQAKDFVCVCSSSLPSAHPWPRHSCFPYPWPLLHSASSDILQKPLFNTWLPHSVWPYIPWRCTHVSAGMYLSSLVPVGFGRLCGLQWCGVYPGLSFLTAWPWYAVALPGGRCCPPRLGCPLGWWGDAPVLGTSESLCLSKSKCRGTSWGV